MRKLLAYLFVPVFLLMAWRLFDLIQRHAVDILFWDHWGYLTPLLSGDSLLNMFLWQHGPHRQGLGSLVTWLLADATGLDMRAESFAIGGILCLACTLALWLKHRLFQRFSWSDLVIPVIFLTPLAAPGITGVPNPAHGSLPLCLVLALCLAWTTRHRALRYTLVVSLHLCLVYTGFGVFACGPVLLLLGLDVFSESRRSVPRLKAPSIALLLCILTLGSFFLGYRFEPAAEGFQFPDPNWPNYPTVVALALARFFWLSGWLGTAAGLLILGAAIGLACQQLLRLHQPTVTRHVAAAGQLATADHHTATGQRSAARHRTVALLLIFSLLFAANMAIGRISIGVEAGTAPRYTALLVPIHLGIYFVLLAQAGLRQHLWLVVFVALHLNGSMFLHASDESAMADIQRLKITWRDAYLATGSIRAADRAAGGPLFPAPESVGMNSMLQLLETRRLSFFRDRTVARNRDPRLIGRWRRQAVGVPEDERQSCTLGADGRYRFERSTGERPEPETGQWKVANQMLYLRRQGALDWLPLGSYELEGRSLVLRLAGAGGEAKQVWQRQE